MGDLHENSLEHSNTPTLRTRKQWLSATEADLESRHQKKIQAVIFAIETVTDVARATFRSCI